MSLQKYERQKGICPKPKAACTNIELTQSLHAMFDLAIQRTYNSLEFLRMSSVRVSASRFRFFRPDNRTREAPQTGKPGSESSLPHRNAGDHTQEPKEFQISMKRSLTLVCMLASGLGVSALAQAGSAATTDPAPNAASAPAVAQAGPTKIAVIMFQPAVMQTNEGQRNFADLQKKYDPKRTQLKSMSDEVESLKKSLQTAGTNLSEAERQNRLKTIDEKEKAYQRLGEDTQNDFQQDLQQTYTQLAEKVFTVLQTYAQQNGYTLVIDGSTQQSPVLWANQGTDISAAVIQAYNQKSGVPAPPTSSATPSAPTPRATTPRPATGTTPKQ
jgi:outer membrane protein